MKIFNKKFYLILASLVLFEALSLVAYFFSDLREIIFFTVVLLYAIFTLKDLKHGVYISLAELVIGSKGYLLYFDYNGIMLSVRISFWLILVSVCFLNFLKDILKKREVEVELEIKDANKKITDSKSLLFLKSNYFPYFSVLFIFIIWALVNGYLNKNEFSNIFFDFNAWLFFALIFPVYSVLREQKYFNELALVLSSAVTWLTAKTLILLFLFSHFSGEALYPLYRWIRVTGVGEITKMDNGFVRIFFQSHIFILIVLFFLLVFLVKYFKENDKKNTILTFIYLVFLGSVVLLGFSRSNWAGLIVGIFLFEIFISRKINFKKLLALNGILLLTATISIGLVIGIVKFPYPKPKTDFNTEILADRAKTISREAGISSRWTLLPKVWSEIKDAPVLGKGFGATVTYKTSDPRVLETSATGEYTTYAFEWGWLDIWLKLGFLGVLAYAVLVIKLFLSGVLTKNENTKWIGLSVGLGVAVLATVSFFSPYMNHPLGIGYLILSSVLLDKYYS